MSNSLTFLAALAALVISTAPGVAAVRVDRTLPDGWKFIKDDVALTAPVDDWQPVTIPHTWNTRDADAGGDALKKTDPHYKYGYYRGACWYERTLQIPASWQGKRVFIRFEAASLVARTYINGTLLGEHRGGFTAFCYEITPYLHFGAANELRVQVDNSHQEDVPPLSGDFNVDGGIYRPVHLIVTDPVCISPLYLASPGVFLTTTSLTDSAAQLEVRTLVSNGSAAPADVRVKTDIADAGGNIVATGIQPATVASGTTSEVLCDINVPSPHRWNGRKDPYLYTAKVSIISGGKVADDITQPLGLRTVEVSESQGFLLNGQPYPIHGVNRHQDWGGQGWAATPADFDTDARIMLDMGVTAVRNTHYPQSDYWHNLCDHNGILAWNEVSLVNEVRATPEFDANAEMQLREFILQLYNHPSIAFWGIFNEIGNVKAADPSPLLEHLKSVVQQMDPSRIIVCAISKVGTPYNQIADHPCFNKYTGWYTPYGTMDADIEKASAEVHKRIALSEYGAGSNTAQHEEGPLVQPKPGGPYHPEEWQTHVHEADWSSINGNPNIWGSFMWVMFDFEVAGRHEGSQSHINDKGMVTQDRKTKKDSYYFYQANWTDKPMVHIASKRMTPRALANTGVEVFSNCSSVELKVNGQSLGIVSPDNVKVFRWPNVALQPGANKIEAIATSNQGTTTDTCQWVLDPTAAPTPAGPETQFPAKHK
jgi:beta-galactosidase